MKYIVNCFKTLIDIISLLFDIIMGFFSSLALAFNYLLKTINLAFSIIDTLPDWLKAFAIITISISIVFFIIGRTAGKNGD